MARTDEAVVRRTLADFKKHGVRSVDVIDIYNATHLPIDRLNHLLHKLEAEGVLAPDGD